MLKQPNRVRCSSIKLQSDGQGIYAVTKTSNLFRTSSGLKRVSWFSSV
jgi:hypothetical protein